jgi:sarcosine oxidase/L-pipecolate oxidase
MTVSTPYTNPTAALGSQSLPASALAPLRRFLRQILAAPAYAAIADRPWSHTRLCHYADTPTGDFLMDYHPAYGRSLFVASGGSGHAFKFLPVLGRCVVDGVCGQRAEEFRVKWAWPERVQGEWSTADGSRGGEGLVRLEDEDGGAWVKTKL